MSSNNTLLNRLANARKDLATTEKAKRTTRKATPVKAVKGKKARKTTNRKPVVGGTIEGHKCLVQKNREQFIADHDWAAPHTSTRDLACAVIAGAPLTGVWAIGPKTVERLTGEDSGAITVESQGGKVTKAKKGKKGKVVAKVAKSQPAKPVKAKETVLHADGTFWQGDVRVTRTGKVMSEAQIAAADAPRRANGSATPKREWAIREALAESGKYDAQEIDAKVSEAYDAGLIEV